MNWLQPFNHWIVRYAGIFGWRDSIEILFFSAFFYYFARWLAHDRQSNLLLYFYGYCLALLSSYYGNLHAINLMLIVCAPITTIILILLHQKTLQKSFIALKKIAPLTPPVKHDWITEFARSCLIAMNQSKELSCIIENKESIATFVTTKLPINAPISQPLLDCILASPLHETKTMLWITAQGQLMGTNTHWSYERDETWLSTGIDDLATWQQNALLITSKTDALFFRLTPTTRNGTIIAQGRAAEGLSTDQAFTIIKKYLSQSSPKKEESVTHEAFNKNKHFYKQSQP